MATQDPEGTVGRADKVGGWKVLNFLLSETPQSLSVDADLGHCRENGVDSGARHSLFPLCRGQLPSVQVSEVTALRAWSRASGHLS